MRHTRPAVDVTVPAAFACTTIWWYNFYVAHHQLALVAGRKLVWTWIWNARRMTHSVHIAMYVLIHSIKCMSGVRVLWYCYARSGSTSLTEHIYYVLTIFIVFVICYDIVCLLPTAIIWSFIHFTRCYSFSELTANYIHCQCAFMCEWLRVRVCIYWVCVGWRRRWRTTITDNLKWQSMHGHGHERVKKQIHSFSVY